MAPSFIIQMRSDTSLKNKQMNITTQKQPHRYGEQASGEKRGEGWVRGKKGERD